MAEAEEEKEKNIADGTFQKKYGNTTYNVSVFFDHDGMTAEDKIKRLIVSDVEKVS